VARITRANWNYDTAAHLLDRAGFGHKGSVRKKTGEAADIRRLFVTKKKQPADFVEKLFPRKPAKMPKKFSFHSVREVRKRWIKQMLRANGRRTVQEKMVLFLHGHFTTQESVVRSGRLLERQISLFRTFATGDFRALVKQVNVDNAMLLFLNGNENEVGNVNENYGRELMELFTLGVFDFTGANNYSQTDVTEVARILTGWVGGSSFSGTSRFISSRHDPGSKTVFAPDLIETPLQNPANTFTTGDLQDKEHELLVDRIFDHRDTEGRPTAARFITRKLWKFFAYDPEVEVGTGRADLALIDGLADVFVNGTPENPVPYNLGNLLREMFVQEEFYHFKAEQGHTVKSPTDFVIGSVRKLSGSMPTATNVRHHQRAFENPMERMGQNLLEPPDVKGWDGNLAWVSTANLLDRTDFAKELAQRDKKGGKELGINIRKILRTWFGDPPFTRAGVVDQLLRILGPVRVDPGIRQGMIDWLGPDDSVVRFDDPVWVAVRLRGLLYNVLSLPQYHVF